MGRPRDDLKVHLWDKAINSVKIGYANRTYDQSIDDRLEFNSTEAIYTVNNKMFINQLDLQSKFRADWKGIWGIYNQVETQDEDVFFLVLDWRTYGIVIGWFGFYGISEETVDHTISSSLAYNVQISTARCLKKNADLITSLSYAKAGDTFYLTANTNKADKKNTRQNLADIRTRPSGSDPWVFERDGIGIADGTPFLLPVVVEFTASVSNDFIDNYQSNRYGFISFQFQDTTTLEWITYNGYIASCKANLAHRNSYNFTLILAAGQDLTHLIR